MKKILSLDGGGVRGILPAEILAYIEARTARPCHKLFDLISGTSTGGIIALGLGIKRPGPGAGAGVLSARALSDFYVERSPDIFPKPSLLRRCGLFGPKYSADPLTSILWDIFKDARLSDAVVPLLIPSYDLVGQVPFFFKSHRARKHPDYDYPARWVARATSAAPTYFPPLHLGDRCLVDGGVFANNPAMAAYAEARAIFRRTAPDTRYLVVSIGTGDRKDNVHTAGSARWGLVKWARLLLPLFIDSVSEAIDYEAEQIIGKDFRRFQYDQLPAASADMDNASPANLAELRRQAQWYIKQHRRELNDLCTELTAGR